MVSDILTQVEELFSDREQWVSFLELSSQKDAIRNSWWQTFRTHMNKRFAIENVVDGWGFTSWGLWDYKWFLKDFGDKSLCLWSREWYGNYSLLLWADNNLYNAAKIANMLQEQKYLPILSAFERLDEIYAPDNPVKLLEHGNFKFGVDTMDGHFNIDRLAWYAHYQPSDLVTQIQKKINNFRSDGEITKLLLEINTETKIMV